MKVLNSILKQVIIALLSCLSIVFGAIIGAILSIDIIDEGAIRVIRRKNRKKDYVSYHE